MEEEDEWGEFGGFQSATGETQAAEHTPALSWATAFEAAPQAPFTPIVTHEPLVPPSTFPATSFKTPAPNIPFNIPSELVVSSNRLPANENASVTTLQQDAELYKHEIPVAIDDTQEANVSAAANAALAMLDLAPANESNDSEAAKEADHAVPEKQNENIAKLNMEIGKLGQEKETIEAKLAHTLLLLDEQKKQNREMQRKTEEEIRKMEDQSNTTVKLLLEEHTRQTKEAILETQQRCLLESKAALDSQADEMKNYIQIQKESYEKSLEEDRKNFAQEAQQMLAKLRQEFEIEQKAVLEEREKHWDEKFESKLEEALSSHTKEATAKFEAALELEREQHKKSLAEEKKNFEAEMEEERKKFEVQCKDCLEAQRDSIWESVQSMLAEERQNWRALADEIRKETQRKTIDFTEEMQRVNSLSRKGRLLGVDVLLDNIKEQLRHFMTEENSLPESESKNLDLERAGTKGVLIKETREEKGVTSNVVQETGESEGTRVLSEEVIGVNQSTT